VTVNSKTPTGSTRPIAKTAQRRLSGQPRGVANLAWALAVRVRTELAAPFAGTVADVGLNEAEITPDETLQVKFTFPLKPFTGETVTVKLAEPPAGMVALRGLTEAVKSDTWSCAVAVCVTGALVPVTVIV
jgi:hypothetical protein